MKAIFLTIIVFCVLSTYGQRPTLTLFCRNGQPPFSEVDESGQTCVGFLVDLWLRIADLIEVDFNMIPTSSSASLQAVQTPLPLAPGETSVYGNVTFAADVTIGFTSLNPSRQERSDFTTSYIETGYSIYVNQRLLQAEEGKSGIANAVFRRGVYFIGCIMVIVIAVAAVFFWLIEQRSKNPPFSPVAWQGLQDSLWFSLGMVLTSGSDIQLRTRLGRIFQAFLLILGVFLTNIWTAIITSNLTLAGISGGINSPNDLAGRRIAIVEDSNLKDILPKFGIIDYVEVPDFPKAVDDIFRSGNPLNLDGFSGTWPSVVDLANDYQGFGGKILDPFEELIAGLAVPFGSPYLRPMNLAIIKLREDGTLKRLKDIWISAPPEAPETTDIPVGETELNLSVIFAAILMFLVLTSIVVFWFMEKKGHGLKTINKKEIELAEPNSEASEAIVRFGKEEHSVPKDLIPIIAQLLKTFKNREENENS